MKYLLLPVALLLASSALAAAPSPRAVIAVQPLGAVDPEIVREVRLGIEATYDADVVVLAARELPRSAYYAPRDRYRADTLLAVLDRTAGPSYTKVVGVTERDISATKDEHYDWGVFGLGSVGGRPCVVSTHRLRRGGASPDLFVERVVKAVNHELGHTFGLDHCHADDCLMEDAGGSIRTVDGETGRLCAACAARTGGVAKR